MNDTLLRSAVRDLLNSLTATEGRSQETLREDVHRVQWLMDQSPRRRLASPDEEQRAALTAALRPFMGRTCLPLYSKSWHPAELAAWEAVRKAGGSPEDARDAAVVVHRDLAVDAVLKALRRETNDV